MNGTTEIRLASKNVTRTIATVTRSVIRLNVSSVRNRVANPAKNIQWFSDFLVKPLSHSNVGIIGFPINFNGPEREIIAFCQYVTMT